ncbi:MAG: carboxypeptidase-like regulatory domain-containing protein, partial [Schleiferiaceae bacterium]
MKSFFSLVLALGFSLAASAQATYLRGSVVDGSTGESIIGAAVNIEGSTVAGMTDLDGNFSLKVAPGTYTVKIAYFTFKTKSITGVVVKAGEATALGSIVLESEDEVKLEEVVITAQSVRNNEAALLTLKKKSTVIMDGISSAKIGLTGDATAVEAAKRVTGVSIEGGKYIFVRGLGDRYSKTTLNGMDIPGLDPDRNTIQMDIFPTDLISNIVVSKAFTADMPADFTGGLLNVETKAFPERKIFNASVSGGYTPSMHFRSDYLTYTGSATDFLGFDGGTRRLPARADASVIPTPISGLGSQATNNFVNSFNKTLGAREAFVPMDFSMGLSMGN